MLSLPLILLSFKAMEMERVTEFPLTHLDRRPRKRPRLGWDVAPQTPKVFDLLTFFVFVFLFC